MIHVLSAIQTFLLKVSPIVLVVFFVDVSVDDVDHSSGDVEKEAVRKPKSLNMLN